MEERPAVRNAFFIEVDYPTEYFHATAVQAIESALSIVDEVHKDGNLPYIPIQVTRLSNALGMFHAKPIRNPTPSRFEISIEIHPTSDLVEFDTLHEIGNIVLQQRLNLRRARPSLDLYYWAHWEDDDFIPVMSAIDAAFQQLGWL